MRITTGIYKGRNIKMPEGIRPTQNIARKAIFDIIGDIKGLTFLELFAGSGAVGFEAASCGAKEVVFVENSSVCIKAINDNISLFQSSNISQTQPKDYLVIQLDANEAIKQLSKQKKSFDIVFFDPPYNIGKKGENSLATPGHKGLAGVPPSAAKKTLQTLSVHDILPPNGLIIVQYSKQESLPEHLGVLNLLKLSIYGDTKLSFYQK
jgi:16S rRNA (guanine966-N2)-methyltransferase